MNVANSTGALPTGFAPDSAILARISACASILVISALSLPMISAGVIAGARRASLIPEVPTMAMARLTGFDISIWHGVLVPPV